MAAAELSGRHDDANRGGDDKIVIVAILEIILVLVVRGHRPGSYIE